MSLAKRRLGRMSTLLFLALGMCLLLSESMANPPPSKTDAVLYGRTYTDLKTVAGNLGMRYQLSGDRKDGTLFSRWTTLKFSKDSKLMLFNKFKIYLGFAVAGNNGKLYLSTADMNKVVRPLLTPQVFSKKPGLKKIVLDPGHGGRDPGASNANLGLREKDLTLDLAKRLRAVLQAKGYQVLLTRSDDRYVENSNRYKYANDVRADLFVSLHFNSVAAASVRGLETYVYTPKDQPSTSRSKILASDRKLQPANRMDAWNILAGFYIHRQLIKSMGGVDRGLKRARFSMLTGLNCPGLLVEGGFFSNLSEGKKIKTTWYRNKLAQTIADGIDAYHSALKKI